MQLYIMGIDLTGRVGWLR